MNHRSLALIFLVVLVSTAARAQQPDLVFHSLGQDSREQIHITWHSHGDADRLEVTKANDPNFEKATLITGAGLSVENQDDIFSGQNYYRHEARLDDLDHGTDYLFRVGDTSLSDVHRFRTAGGFGTFHFIHMSDVHAYPPIGGRVKKAQALVEQAQKKEKDIEFIVFTGDLTAWGAEYSHWHELASAPFVSDYPIAATPGNHDYYTSNATTVDERFFNAVLSHPDNGASVAPNTTYWFKVNGAVFISLNSEARATEAVDAQKAWVKQVVEENPAQYYIVYTHRGFFDGSGSSVSKTSTYNLYGKWLEALQVDLVLAGHEHVYVRTKPLQEGKVSSDGLGTVYITANQIGDRGRQATSTPGELCAAIHGEGSSTSMISVITVSDTGIEGKMFDADGKEFDTYTIPARRAPELDSFDPQEYINAFSVEPQPPELTRGLLRFQPQGYERVRRIDLFDSQNHEWVYASFAPSQHQEQEEFGPLVPGQTYDFDLEILLKDGQTKHATLSLVNRLDAGTYDKLRVENEEGKVWLRWINHFVTSEIERIEVQVNGDWSIRLAADATETDITEGIRRGSNTITFGVLDRYETWYVKETLAYEYTAPSPGTFESEPTSGCAGCRTPGASPRSSAWWWILALVLLYGKRGRQRPLWHGPRKEERRKSLFYA
ncbi:MAG TPA: metallophosphoesterase family protein [Polyangiaceae bacterium]|nr:MAG: Calcineurin-like phosphoesterase [Deltaproteobacteria bacterium ADurb.Bin207]HNS97400.1 metallophosphoesterase family protein [Polyangiaceae bacterium]HNZ23996.1 metallophosphoesterase family protein [Polyangiaceae bacterium]HOD21753.1 metallophosphoesterase family protein [Polyangiaceae bacterium]HOH02279.1 metallophosphoesterase family protein [Polyangiaceae bacterium]